MEALRIKREGAAAKRAADALMTENRSRKEGNGVEVDDDSDEDEEEDLLDWRAKQLHK